MKDAARRAPEAELEQQLREINGALLVSSVRQHELAEQARQAEAAARESDARSRALFAAAPMAVFVCDRDAVLLEYNSRAAELWGREPVRGVERHCGSTRLWLPDGAHLPHDKSPVLEVLRTGVAMHGVEVLVERPDGSRLPVLVNFAALRDARGEIVGAVTTFVDITERKGLEDRLRVSEVRYRRLFQSAKDGVLILDADTGTILDANAVMAGLVGMEAAELLGKELHQIGMFKDMGESKDAFRRLQAAGYLRCDHVPLRNHLGERVEVEFIASVYQEGRALVAQCNVRDISLRIAMEGEIRDQAETLAAEARRKDEFLAMLGHELRNPLAPIRSAVYLLRLHERGDENPLQRQAREIIERQVGNLTKLVGDLLEVSRVLSGRIRLELQPVDLNQVVRHAVETVAPLIEQRRHELAVHHCDEGLWTLADATRIEEVIINLLNNAAKYTDPGGRLEVHCERAPGGGGSRVQVRVRDNGIGIDEKLLPRIFDLFTQADRSLHRAQGGLGIGLSLAHRLVELHGGTLAARSPPEGESRGSEFIVTLPLAPAPDTGRPAPPAPETLQREAGGTRVLVVDDNLDLVMMLASALRHQGYVVQSTYTGPDGLRLALGWRPDVVLLDIGLPGLDGYEVARRLRADHGMRGARLIALTGYGRETDIALAHEAGFDAHLTKPYDFDELEKLLAPPHTDHT